MDSTRQNKIGRLIQKDLSEILQFDYKNQFENSIITVTKVNVTKDLSLARVNLSIFTTKDKNNILKQVELHKKDIRRLLGIRTKNQLRIIPELQFFIDDTLDYLENIDRLLKQ